MRSLPGLILFVSVGVCWAQVQIPANVEDSPPGVLIKPWTQSGLLDKPEPGVSEDKIRLLKSAADANDTDALMKLAALATSDIDAFSYVFRAAELGRHDAEYELASMYAQGKGTSQDMEKAVFWGRKSAEGGNTAAQFALGLTLARKETDPVARDEGISWIVKSSESGNAQAALSLATIYATGAFGLPVDEGKAEAVLKPFAEKNDVECQIALASLYHLGKSYEAQRSLGIFWLGRAKENGSTEAAHLLTEIQKGQK